MTNVVQDFQKVFSERQQTRLLRLTFPYGDAPYYTLLANRLTGSESLSRDFEFKVEILSDNASLPLKNFQGKMITVELARGRPGFWVVLVASILIALAIAHYKASAVKDWISRSYFGTGEEKYPTLEEELKAFNNAVEG